MGRATVDQHSHQCQSSIEEHSEVVHFDDGYPLGER